MEQDIIDIIKSFYIKKPIQKGIDIPRGYGYFDVFDDFDNKWIICLWNEEPRTYKNKTRTYMRHYTIFVGEFSSEKIKQYSHTTKIYLEPNLPEAIKYIKAMFAE